MRVVICGAGVIGASIAYFCARRGADVTIVERVSPACAASGKSGGFLALDWCDGGPQAALARNSFALHEELAGSLGTDYGYRRMDTLSVASSELRDVEPYRGASSPGWLDGACVVGGQIGTQASTAQIHPRRFTQALVDAAANAGANLRIGAVRGIATSSGGDTARGVLVGDEIVEADAVVIAMGPWSGGLAQGLGLPAIGGLLGYSITLRPAVSPPAHALFVEYELANGEKPSPEIVPRPDGEVYVCGLSGNDPVPEDPAQVRVDGDKCAALARIAGRVSSVLGDAQITSRGACYRPICADATPIIGRAPAVDGAFVATGHNCWGMLNAPGTGLAMSELLLDESVTSLDLSPFDPVRFRAHA